MPSASGSRFGWRVAFKPVACVMRLAVIGMIIVKPVAAGPWLMPGDPWLKADIQSLADVGVITSPISSWPLSWGDIAQDLNAWTDDDALPPSARAAFDRMRDRSRIELQVNEPALDFGARLAEKPQLIRGFADTPRGDVEAWGSGEWTGERFAGRIKLSFSNQDLVDSQEVRFDGSYAAVALGNWVVGASLINRWWGPGWNGSLILSSNARPIPALVLERNFSTAFESRWLSWLGPWSTSVIWGQMEDGRAVPNTRFFGWRFNFKPTQSLEIGLLRTAQWCGSGRQCDLDAFFETLVGDTNIDPSSNTDVANQLAGLDLRWASPVGDWPYAVYGQFIGEDEAGGFPSRYMGQLGVEAWGYLAGRGTTWHAYAEFADTTCQFHENSRIFNCAYNNSFYPTGYRYRGRSIGHATDNDARSIAIGAIVNDARFGEWTVSLRRMELNRAGQPDPTNTLTAVPSDATDFDVAHRRDFDYFSLDIGVGAERRENTAGNNESDVRVYLGVTVRL